jgi:NAD-dependent SIR2 family protein deacetylase
MNDDVVEQAAEAVRRAEALLITAGAGMGVDSGLPDFRGNEGFWRAYPAARAQGLSFMQLANPRWFVDDPALAWGFYGHRLALYRRTAPHPGFAILAAWARRAPEGAFVFTSNVDGQFQRAGFDDARVAECHGAIDWLQCLRGCGIGLFSAEGTTVEVDEATLRARAPLPSCPRCHALARPAILMFGDGDWEDARSSRQEAALVEWIHRLRGTLTVIECGAGGAIPTVRHLGEELLERSADTTLIRINPREPEGPPGTLSLACGALEGLRAIDRVLARSDSRGEASEG